MDSDLPKPFSVQQPSMEHFKVARRCNISAEIVKKKDKRVYLRVKLFYRTMKIMQNEYELDLNKLSKL